ncbi:hypothetical protein [Serratia symbiotica]|uniref:hypothetical protein n=1 Tax=Serratia symbiotica TaxID=138074 RepID=UPI0030CE9899
MYALPESCPFTGLFIPNPIYSTKPAKEANSEERTVTKNQPPIFSDESLACKNLAIN